MNFLAHIYLSGTSEKILVGNYIGDFVKGRNFENYHPEIQKGIILHRAIDSFTDTHHIVKESKKFFVEKYDKFSGVVIDILYDHFLAINWRTYYHKSLSEYVDHTNKILARYYKVFPEGVKRFFPKYVMNGWVKHYDRLYGIENVLKGMSRNTSLPDHTDYAMEQLLKNYETLNLHFSLFFTEIFNHVLKHHGVKLSRNYVSVA